MRKLFLLLLFCPLFCFSQTIKLKQISDFPSQTGNNGKFLTTDGSTPSWATGGSASSLDTSSMININLWSGLGLSDNRKFQYATDYARIRGKHVFAGWNNDRNSRTFIFDSAVLYQSHCNYYLVGCTIKKSNTCRDNLFRSANCGTGITNPLSTAYTDVSFTGYGWSIEGADNPRSSGDAYATISTTPTIANGYSYGTDAGVSGQSQHGDWRNNGIQGSNVSHIVISGGTVRNMEAYGITFGHTGYALIENMTAEMYGYANNDTTRRMANQGTIDFHQGCHDITVRNCFGFSQDDFLAFNLTNNTDSTAGHWGYYPEGDSATAAFDSNYNIHCYNIHVGSNANTIRTFIPPGSFKGYNMWFVDISNELKPTDPFFHRLNGVEASAIVYGATQTGFYGGNISWGQWSNLNADKIQSYYTKYLIRVQNRIQDCHFSNLYKSSNLSIDDVYKDGSFAEFKNVFITNDWDATNNRMVLANQSGKNLFVTDSVGIFYRATTLGNNIEFMRAGMIAGAAFGTQALHSLGTTSLDITAIGNQTFYSLTSGSAAGNTGLGSGAGYTDVSGSGNTYLGYQTGYLGTGNNSTAGGYQALYNNTQNAQTAFGSSAMYNNTTGDKNVSFGQHTLYNNQTGSENTAIGNNALGSTTLANYSFVTALGHNAGAANRGSRNTFLGARNGQTNTTGTSNSGFGFEGMGNASATTVGNVYGGDDPLYNVTGNYNVAFGGISTGEDLTSGSWNVMIGSYSQSSSATASGQGNYQNVFYIKNGYQTTTKSATPTATGSVGIGVGSSSITARLHIAAGTATANTAPLKLTSGTNLTTPEAGAMEYDGTNLYFSPSTTRLTADLSLTGSATLDFGSTSAQNSADLTITVTGAADGDVVSLGVPNAAVNANSNFTAWVSATNTVTVRFNNYSSGAIDPASGTFKVRVIK